MNAIIDALWRSHRVRHIDMPATPRRIWEAINTAQKSPI
jgi:carbon-monoxide dehydrogenase large subunit